MPSGADSNAPPHAAAPQIPQDMLEGAKQASAWPFEEARKIIARIAATGQSEVIFETGYGPSGLPHIGTFGEVARTTMVRHAFRVLTEDKVRTRLLAFSDDMTRCARCRTMCRTRRCSRPISASR